RVFVLNNVHESAPVVFETRWTMSFLRGPMTREEIRRLMAGRVPSAQVKSNEAAQPATTGASAGPAPIPQAVQSPQPGREVPRPSLPADVAELFWPVAAAQPSEAPVVYRPHLLARLRLHYVHSKSGLDAWESVTLIVPVPEGKLDVDWEHSTSMAAEAASRFIEQSGPGVRYASAPAALADVKSYARWKKAVVAHVYRAQPLILQHVPELKAVSLPGESAGDFRARLALAGREGRDQRFEKIKNTYAKKLATAHERVRRAHARVAAENAQATDTSLDAALSVGAGVLGAMLGRKVASVANVSRARSAVRAAGRVKKERDDRASVEQTLAEAQAKYAELEAEFRQRLAELEQSAGAANVEELRVPPRKSDIEVALLACAWIP
ncbi:MAG TPA: hypothetical protein VK524_25030, partial [Polyangiaceae bacterium]|nr:hypothetical protein [Polyangiaceae bacterium]